MIPCAMTSATPEFTMARLIANAQAMVIKISHDIYLYIYVPEKFGPCHYHSRYSCEKNISRSIPGSNSSIKGNSPTVAPTIINTNKVNANQRFFLPAFGSVSLPLANNTNTEESPHVEINESSAHSTNVSPSRNFTRDRLSTILTPLRFISFTSAP